MTTLTHLRPGAMGANAGGQATRTDARVRYVPTGRSLVGLERARAASDFALSACPPHTAEDVAHEVLSHPFRGVYVEADAIGPDRTQRIAAACAERDVLMLVRPHTAGLPHGSALDNSPKRSVGHSRAPPRHSGGKGRHRQTAAVGRGPSLGAGVDDSPVQGRERSYGGQHEEGGGCVPADASAREERGRGGAVSHRDLVVRWGRCRRTRHPPAGRVSSRGRRTADGSRRW